MKALTKKEDAENDPGIITYSTSDNWTGPNTGIRYLHYYRIVVPVNNVKEYMEKEGVDEGFILYTKTFQEAHDKAPNIHKGIFQNSIELTQNGRNIFVMISAIDHVEMLEGIEEPCMLVMKHKGPLYVDQIYKDVAYQCSLLGVPNT